MVERPRQLALDLPISPKFGRDDFLVSSANEEAYALIEAWPQWPDPVLILQGPGGSGKSHLAAIWAERAHAWTLPAAKVTIENAAHVISNGALVLEDLDKGTLNEPALFHLLNMARARDSYLLLTLQEMPELQTPDLLSRLRLAPSCTLDAPDEALLKAVLVKLFLDRQIIVDTGVIEFLHLRIERSLAKAAEIVSHLDQEALSRGMRLNRHNVAGLFREMER